MRWFPLVVCLGCGDNLKYGPDAGLPDSPVAPDAALCGNDEVSCDGACLDVSGDEANCGDCGNACQGGEVCTNANCNCPTGVIPGIVFPTGFEQFFPLGILNIALAPTLSLNGLNGLIFGYDNSLPLDTDIDLATVGLGSTPFVGSAVGLDITSTPPAIDASYFATAGTIRFTKRCDTEIEGTLTNATFNGVGGGLLGGLPTIDPEGCVVQVNSLSFHLATAPCEQL